VGPPDRGGIEYEVVLWPGIDGGRIHAVAAAVTHGARCEHFQTANIGRLSHPLEAHQARNAVSIAHTGAFEDPVFFIRADPVGRGTVIGVNVSRSDQRRFSWRKGLDLSNLWEVLQVALLEGSKLPRAHDGTVRRSGRVGEKRDQPGTSIAAEKTGTHAMIDRP